MGITESHGEAVRTNAGLSEEHVQPIVYTGFCDHGSQGMVEFRVTRRRFMAPVGEPRPTELPIECPVCGNNTVLTSE